MAKCWEERGCDEEMQSNCPHPTELMDNCPTKCVFANTCLRPSHSVTSDADLIFDTSIDHDKAVKDTCFFCEFFLRNGPKRVAS